jgi:alkyl hydroperoxide reductase subunit AhpC
MRIPVVADFTKSIARSYGVLLPEGVPLRALFMISPTGKQTLSQ